MIPKVLSPGTFALSVEILTQVNKNKGMEHQSSFKGNVAFPKVRIEAAVTADYSAYMVQVRSSAKTFASRLITFHSYQECCLENYRFQGR